MLPTPWPWLDSPLRPFGSRLHAGPVALMLLLILAATPASAQLVMPEPVTRETPAPPAEAEEPVSPGAADDDDADAETAAASADAAAASTSPRTPVAPPVGQEDPSAALFTFLQAMNEASEDPAARERALAVLDLSGVNEERGWDHAVRLWEVLNRIRVFERSDLPGPFEVTLTPNLDRVRLHPNPRYGQLRTEAGSPPPQVVDLVRGDDRGWHFSAETVAGSEQLYRAVRHIPRLWAGDAPELSWSLWIEEQLPPVLVDQQFVGVAYWKLLGLLVALLTAVTFDLVVRMFLTAISKRFARGHQAELDKETVSKAFRPAGMLAGATLFLGLLPLLNLPDDAHWVLTAAARVFLALSAVWAAWRLTDFLAAVASSRLQGDTAKTYGILVPLVRKTVKIFIVAVGLVYGAGALDINIMPMLAGLGVGGLAFAFAAKDTIENFFGSVAVVLDKPFEVGDWVAIKDTEGIVEQVGFRSTRIRTFYNSQVTVPNAELVRATVDNFGRRRYRRWSTHIGVQYDTTPDQLVAFTEGIRELVRTHPYTRKDYFQVRVHGFGASSIDILIYVFHEVEDWSMELRERERLILDMVRLADVLGVRFAFPTQTVHLFKEEHADYQARHAPPKSLTERRASVSGIRAAQKLTADQTWRHTPPGPVPYPPGPTTIDDETDEPVEGLGDQGESAIEDRSAGR